MRLPRLAAGQWLLLAVPAAMLAVWLAGDAFHLRLATRILVFAIIATGLNLIVGYTGLVSFGHAAFVGVGAYTVAILNFHGVQSGWLAWPAAVVLAGLAALVIGAIALRTSGVYFIMITLAFAQMLFYLATGLQAYGGDDGIRLKARNAFGPIDIDDPAALFFLVGAIYLLVLYGLARVVRSRFGRTLRAIKDNERRMQSMGYNTYLYKLAGFVLAGMTAGLGGALNANLIAHVSPAMLHWVLSGDLLIIIILGGVGTFAGPTLGAAAFILLEELLSAATKHWMLPLGLIMLGVILFHRGGLHALFPGRRRDDG